MFVHRSYTVSECNKNTPTFLSCRLGCLLLPYLHSSMKDSNSRSHPPTQQSETEIFHSFILGESFGPCRHPLPSRFHGLFHAFASKCKVPREGMRRANRQSHTRSRHLQRCSRNTNHHPYLQSCHRHACMRTCMKKIVSKETKPRKFPLATYIQIPDRITRSRY